MGETGTELLLSTALSVQFWADHTVPELLQTEDYARALQDSLVPAPAPEAVDKAIAELREHQRLLTAPTGPHLAFVLDEGVLRRVAGGYRVLRAQLDHLLTCTRLPRVVLQVAPLSFCSALPGAMALVETETARHILPQGTGRVAALAQHFSTLRAYALTPRQSAARLKEVWEGT